MDENRTSVTDLKLEISDCERPCSWSVTPVLADCYETKVDLVDVYVASISRKQDTSKIVRELCAAFPLPNLRHLKRVKSGDGPGDGARCIVTTVADRAIADNERSVIKTVLRDLNPELEIEGLSAEMEVVGVPSHPPLTRAQYLEAKKMWPVLFHEDKWITAALTGTLFNAEDAFRMEHFMRLALDAARKKATATKDANGIVGVVRDAVGAIVVDPATDEVIAVACDRREEHPLRHAVMVCIDNVAKAQGGGAWPPKASSRDSVEAAKNPELPYLCTSYDMYVTREPCVMCSMALVHSRIRTVFYGRPTRNGGLGSAYKIHCQDGLNHHYRVFRGVLEAECAQLGT